MSADLVFLHGIGGSGEIWAPQTGHFVPRHRVLAWNAPGYGGAEPIDDVTFPALAARLAEDMTEAGFQQAVIVGHSFGGMVAQQLARDHPERVTGLVLSGTSAAFGNPDGDFQRKFVAARTRPLDQGKTMADVARAVAPSLVGDGAPAEAVELAISCMSAVPEKTYRGIVALLTTFDLRSSLQTISVPALLIAGTDDRTAPASMMERMAGRIPGAGFETMEGAGHLAPLEQPAEFNRLVETFIAQEIEIP
ncbi:MAG: alpha/beta fold hydrolase [Pseudomonadota bacterium]